MSGFSGALQLTDLDDFITPSQVKTRSFIRIYLLYPFLTYLKSILATGMHQAGPNRHQEEQDRLQDHHPG